MLSTLMSPGAGLQLPGTALALRLGVRGSREGVLVPQGIDSPFFPSREGSGCSATPVVAGGPEQGRKGKPTRVTEMVET